MASREELYQALRNADAAGDAEGARKLAAYIQGMPADAPTPAASAPEEPFAAKLGRQVLNAGAGAIRGAGSIGATLMYPIDAGARALGIQNDIIGRSDRREAMTDALRTLGADPNTLAFQGGKIGGEIAGTMGAGGLVANTAARVPGVAAAAPNLLNAIRTAGMSGGSMPVRMAGGAINGAVSAGLVDPQAAGVGAAVGAALPPGIAIAGKAGNMLGRAISGPQVAPETAAAVQQAQQAGYVIPPTQVKPSLMNRLLEGTAGKVSTAQNASVKNQAVTNRLVAEEVGLPAGEPITTEALDKVRSEAGKAYGEIAKLGKLDLGRATAPPGVRVVVNTAGEGKSRFVNAPDVIDAWKQANHDATDYYRAYARDANPETLAKAKAAAAQAKQIDEFLMGALERVKGAQPDKLIADLAAGRKTTDQFVSETLKRATANDLGQSLKDARVRIAKTYSAEAALDKTTGNIDAKKLAQMLQKDKPLSGGIRAAGEFGGAFPKASQMPEKMGSLPQFSPLDVFGAGALGAVSGNPLALTLPLLRPAARAAALSPAVQNRLAQPGANQLANLLADPALQQAVLRASPALAADR